MIQFIIFERLLEIIISYVKQPTLGVSATIGMISDHVYDFGSRVIDTGSVLRTHVYPDVVSYLHPSCWPLIGPPNPGVLELFNRRSVECVWCSQDTDCGAIVLVSSLLMIVLIIYVVNIIVLRLGIGSPVGRGLLTHIIDLFTVGVMPVKDPSTVRQTFLNCVPVSVHVAKDAHTHPNSAAVRNTASEQIDLTCRLLGLEPYYIQQSNSDIKHKRNGCRTYYWAKDLATPGALFAPGPSDVIAITDTDHYIAMDTLISQYPRIYMISTFQPTCVAYSGDEYCFTFDRNNMVEYIVRGGATYKHDVWNYGSDVLYAVCKVWFGLCYKHTAYHVEKRLISDHHVLICLVPIRTFIIPFFDISGYLSGCKLERLKIVVGEFLRMKIMTAKGIMCSTGRVGSYNCATIPAVSDDMLASVARLSSTPLTIAHVKTHYKTEDSEIATILTEFHRDKLQHKLPVVFPVEASVFNYQFVGHQGIDFDADRSLTPFMNPVMLGSYAPVLSRNNDEATIKGRITDVASDAQLNPHLIGLIDEFASFIVPDEHLHQGHPVDIDTVFDKQPTPSQQAILKDGSLSIRAVLDAPVKSFQKKESYGNVKEPRNISTIPAPQKLHYSAYIYALTTCVKQHKWYAFGLTPLEISNRVAQICNSARTMIASDMSRFDGRVSMVLRTLERQVMLRYFAEQYHNDLVELANSQQRQKAITRFRIRYDTGLTRLSGSPETSCLNTIDNTFIAYCALRAIPVNEPGHLTPVQAWEALGIYGGDDGLTANIHEDVFKLAATKVGQKAESQVINRGAFGVKFLNRYYSPYVWTGDNNSYSDVERALSKLHVTPMLSISPMEKLAQKAIGYYLTDRHTPLLGDFATAFVTVNKIGDKIDVLQAKLNIKSVANYFAQYPLHEQFPNDDNGWMVAAIQNQMPLFDFKTFHDWLAQCLDNPSLFLNPKLCVDNSSRPHLVKQKCEVNGDIYYPGGSPSVSLESPGQGGSVRQENQSLRKPKYGEKKMLMCEEHTKKPGTCKFGFKCLHGVNCRFRNAKSGKKESLMCEEHTFKKGTCRYGVKCTHGVDCRFRKA